ncbi:Serine/threonine-protein kinase MRCK beta [Coemansia sp. RSA 2598]|nr:Serine/threonine-protein kinase MRCK beta [Coemansia sp. RSA 2598]
MPAAKTLEERSRTLTDALLAQDVLAYRGAIDTGAMLDTLLALHEELNDRQFQNSPNIKEFVERYKKSVDDVKGWRLCKKDFEFIRTLARGQFGIVDIVRCKHNKGVYAMKTLNKQALLSQREQAAFLEERDVLVLGKDSPWIPDLYASFQDKENLYIVMEFVAGGDLFSMLDRCENAIIDEDAARFYAAELVLALEDLHKIGYIHRDCKPQNTLLDERGHVKLADFGSCARIDASGAHEAKTSVPVGTCDYIAPETLRARELGSSNGGGGVVSTSSDWWSLGTVLYEMLYGDPPFYSDSVPETYGKIMSSEKHLSFDDSIEVSEAAKDLMRRLLVRQEDRLGLDGIKSHPFFAGVNWDTVRSQEAPFVPRISSPDDTSNFSVGDESEEDIGMAMARASSSRLGHGREYAGEQLPFIGFTYLPPAFAFNVKRLAPSTPRGPRDDPSQIRSLKTKIEQMEAAESRWHALQAEWDEDRRRMGAERRELELKVAALEAHIQAQAPVAVPPATRDSAMQTEAPATADGATETEPELEAEHKSEQQQQQQQQSNPDPTSVNLAQTLEQQFGGQTVHLTKLVEAINCLATATNEKLEQGLQMQKKEFGALTTLLVQHQHQQQLQSSGATTAVQSPSAQPHGVTSSPRVTSVASLTQVQNHSPARLSIGSMGQTTRNSRRSISAIEDAPLLESHPKSVVATLVNEMSRNNSGDQTSSRQSLALSPAAMNRVARAERRVSAGVASDALSVIGNKCDRLAALLEQYAGEIGAIRQSQNSLVAICNTLQMDVTQGLNNGLAEIPESPTSDASRRGRRRTEQPRRRGVDMFAPDRSEAPMPQPQQPHPDTVALEMYKAAADELVATLRAQLATSEEARASAESRATELLSWIGRESKGRALLEDMIRTAQQACKMAEEKLSSMIGESDALRSRLSAKEEEVSSLQAAIETRDKELRHLRRASRKALDQLADIKTSQQQQQQQPTEEKTRESLDAELQEAAALHVRLQFEIARLEGEVSRLDSEKTQLAKELGLKDSKLKAAEARSHKTDSLDGIRVRPMDENGAYVGGDDDEEANKYGSVGTKSHKRFKVQLQNMQKHIEYLETKLALAVSENDQLKSQHAGGAASHHQHHHQQQHQAPPTSAGSSHGIRFPGFSRSNSSNNAGNAHGTSNSSTDGTAGSRSRPLTSMFPNLASNMSANGFSSTASLNLDERTSADSGESSGHGAYHGHHHHPQGSARRRVPTEPMNGASTRPRNDSFTSSFERMRSPFKGFRKHFT